MNLFTTISDHIMRWGHLPIIGLILAHMHGVRFRLNVWRNGSPVPRIRWSVYIERKSETKDKQRGDK